jgi:GT2 family glycosyltransferase
MKPVDILMVCYHRKNFTHMTLESIYTRTRTPYRLIVVDNGSPEDMQDMLREYQRRGIIKVLCLLDRNYGLEYAKNTGLRFVDSEPYFVNTDNDLLIEAPSGGTDWIQKLVTLMDNHPNFGAIACRPQILYGVPNIFAHEYNDDGTLKAKHLTDDEQVGFFYDGNGPCGGAYRIMRTDPVKKVRWRDEWNDSRSEEWRICGELNRQGYKCGYARYVRCYHLFGDGNWGYQNEVPHYHKDHDFGEPQDVEFDPLTCKPKREQYGHE